MPHQHRTALVSCDSEKNQIVNTENRKRTSRSKYTTREMECGVPPKQTYHLEEEHKLYGKMFSISN